jgi:hypothetical protein
VSSILLVIFRLVHSDSFRTVYASTMLDGYETFLDNDDVLFFHANGYVLKRSCFRESEVVEIQEVASAAVNGAIKAANLHADTCLERSGGEVFAFLDGSRVVYNSIGSSVSVARVNGIGGMAPSLMNHLSSEKMVRTFMKLLRTTELEHIICQLHPKMPGDGIAFPRHRDIEFRKAFDPDWEDILGNGSYAICILPIDRMTQENGGLWVDKGDYPAYSSGKEDIQWIEMNPGDLLFMNPYLYHGSGPNTSSFARRTLLSGFCAYGANHKAYPGAMVNTTWKLSSEEGILERGVSPWRAELSALDANH